MAFPPLVQREVGIAATAQQQWGGGAGGHCQLCLAHPRARRADSRVCSVLRIPWDRAGASLELLQLPGSSQAGLAVSHSPAGHVGTALSVSLLLLGPLQDGFLLDVGLIIGSGHGSAARPRSAGLGLFQGCKWIFGQRISSCKAAAGILPEELRLPHPWEGPRPAWSNLGLGKVSLPTQGGNWMIEDPSHPKQSGILCSDSWDCALGANHH